MRLTPPWGRRRQGQQSVAASQSQPLPDPQEDAPREPAPLAEEGDAAASRRPTARAIDNDSPIRSPTEDRLGVAPFARMIARSLGALEGAEGTVVALNAPWGGGKSSVINLVLHELATTRGSATQVVTFNPWWFSGSDHLARGFFQALASAMNRTLAEDGKAALGAFIGRLGSLSTYTDAASVLAEKGVASAAAKLLIGASSVEDEHAKLAAALRAAECSFLVVVDDIDRLSPDEALLVFGLVKSVGRLPNVTYLLAFDRLLTGRLLRERFPSEGDQYLEKIVQATFDVPSPAPETLQRLFLEDVDRLMIIPDDGAVYFLNLFHDIVAPHLISPRQVVRLAGSLKVTWPAVAGEVNPGDFLAVEALRLFRPTLYRNIRNNRQLLTTKSAMGGMHVRADDLRRLYEAALLADIAPEQHDEAKLALKRLFPLTQAVWSNMMWTDDWLSIWRRDRLVGAHAHFPSYFQYALDEDVLPAQVAAELIARAGDADYVRQTLLGGLAVTRSRGGTWAALLLSELSARADAIAEADVPVLLTTVFSIADRLDVEADAGDVSRFGSNGRRIAWLLRPLLMDRFDQARRSQIVRQAAQTAEPGYLTDLADRAMSNYRPADPDGPARNLEEALTDEATARWLKDLAYQRMMEKVRDGTILDYVNGATLLWDLLRIAPDDGEALRAVTNGWLDDPGLVVKVAGVLTSTGLTQGFGFDGMGDRVARRVAMVHVSSLPKIIDADRLKQAVEVALATGQDADATTTLQRFLDGWAHDDEQRGRRNLDEADQVADQDQVGSGNEED